ncbi:MAG: hypothetical protein K0R61_2078 [Microvirga sp.]|jgi:hypothetical protein|nr:hypothetical protein [Microvirga sp.]MCE3249385.1 hypothetical protein [Geminicoccaceae bacterium]MDF2971628.1 hypothetical protein [Microvirga sp.]
MSNIIPLTDPRVLARLEAIERRLDALMMEPEHRDDDEHVALQELHRELTAMTSLKSGSASGGATASDGGAK